MELTFDALSKNYGKKQALIGFSAELTGGIYGLLGPNGAGKSTLMNILTGNLRQTAGEIRFNGAEIRSLGAAAMRTEIDKMVQSVALNVSDADTAYAAFETACREALAK